MTDRQAELERVARERLYKNVYGFSENWWQMTACSKCRGLVVVNHEIP